MWRRRGADVASPQVSSILPETRGRPPNSCECLWCPPEENKALAAAEGNLRPNPASFPPGAAGVGAVKRAPPTAAFL